MMGTSTAHTHNSPVLNSELIDFVQQKFQLIVFFVFLSPPFLNAKGFAL